MIASHMVAHKEPDPRAARRQLLAGNTAFAEVRGAVVPALRPPTWRPGRPAPPVRRREGADGPRHGVR
ncbi:hypothetical protein GCM10020295_71830 [Streptomyces cinereospinus]